MQVNEAALIKYIHYMCTIKIALEATNIQRTLSEILKGSKCVVYFYQSNVF